MITDREPGQGETLTSTRQSEDAPPQEANKGFEYEAAADEVREEQPKVTEQSVKRLLGGKEPNPQEQKRLPKVTKGQAARGRRAGLIRPGLGTPWKIHREGPTGRPVGEVT